MNKQNIGTISAGFGLAALLAGCAAPAPAAPSVLALPGPGKSTAQFQQDDNYCRQYALYQTGGVTPSQAANQSGASSAVLGTLAGAALGAGLGSLSGNVGAGAAVGAAGGLLVGGTAGAGAAQASAANVQQRYDYAYIPCMVSRGNTVQNQPGYGSPYGPYPPPPPGYYAPPPPPGYYPPPPPPGY